MHPFKSKSESYVFFIILYGTDFAVSTIKEGFSNLDTFLTNCIGHITLNYHSIS